MINFLKMNKIALYPSVPRVRRMESGVIVTVPDQVMSIKEMFRRFVRREPLPAAKNGIYIESDYDLEKLAKEDRVVQEEVLAEMKVKVADKKKKLDEGLAAEAAKKQKEKEDARRELFEDLKKQFDPKGGGDDGSKKVS